MTQNSMDWTHEQMLKEVEGVCSDKEARPDCMMVVALWNDGGKFDTRFWNVGLRASEMIALFEVQKARLVELMNNGDRSEE